MKRIRTRMRRQVTAKKRRETGRTMSRAVAEAARTMSRAAMATASRMRPAAEGNSKDKEAGGDRQQQ